MLDASLADAVGAQVGVGHTAGDGGHEEDTAVCCPQLDHLLRCCLRCKVAATQIHGHDPVKSCWAIVEEGPIVGDAGVGDGDVKTAVLTGEMRNDVGDGRCVRDIGRTSKNPLMANCLVYLLRGLFGQ
jgi:hypothetical protein